MTESKCVPYTVFDDKFEELTIVQTKQLTHHPSPELVSVEPPVRPKGGEVYVYPVEVAVTKLHRCDQYTWINGGKRGVPKDIPVAHKTHFYIKSDSHPGGQTNQFKRVEISFVGSDATHVVVHYVGDEGVAPPVPSAHGNSKNPNRPFIRQDPRIYEKVATARKTGEKPAHVYRRLVGEETGAGNDAVMKPRSLEKVNSVFRQEASKERYSRDEIANLYELAHDLRSTDNANFITEIRLWDRLVVGICYAPFVSEVRQILKLSESKGCPFYLSYDTTFKLGDFCLSVLAFRHSFFQKSPIIPLAFMIHDKRYRKDHESFVYQILEAVVDKIGIIKACKSKLPLVTDREFEFDDAPDLVQQVYCWNHIVKSVERYVRYQLKGGSVDVSYYSQVVKSFLTQPSLDAYKQKYKEESQKWSPAFSDHYSSNLEWVVKCSGYWVLEQLGVGNPFSGITTNSSESFNTVLQRLIDWHERPIDAIVLSLYHLCAFFEAEITRGKHGIGNYTPRDDESGEVQVMPPHLLGSTGKLLQPGEIVESLKKSVCDENMSSNLASQENRFLGNDKATNEQAEDTPGVAEAELQIPEPDGPKFSSRVARAKHAIKAGNIHFEAKSGTFIVIGTGGNRYAVTLSPEKCGCPASRNCYHILAVKMILKLDSGHVKPVPLSQLRRRARKSVGKPGRKKPRLGDFEVSAAPDSVQATTVEKGLEPTDNVPASQVSESKTDGEVQLGSTVRLAHSGRKQKDSLFKVVQITKRGMCRLENIETGEKLANRVRRNNLTVAQVSDTTSSVEHTEGASDSPPSKAPKKGWSRRWSSHEQRVSGLQISADANSEGSLVASHEQRVPDLQISADANSERSLMDPDSTAGENFDDISEDEVIKPPVDKRRRVASGSDSEDSTPKPATCFTFPIRWGGGDDYDITNSCPIDNFLALLLPGANMVPAAAFICHLEESELPADQALLACLNVLKSGNVGGAKDIWVEFVGSDNPGIFSKSLGRTQANLWGHLDEMFLEKFRNDEYLALQLSVCSHSTCPNKIKNTGHKILSIAAPEGGLSLGETVQMQVDAVLAITDEVPCIETVDPDSIVPPHTLTECVKLGTWFDTEAGVHAVHTVCSGTRTVMPDGLPEGTWLVPLDIRLIPCRMLFEMPNKLRAGMYTYRLIGLTVYKDLHFRAYIRDKDQDAWYHYDGLGKPMGERVDKPLSGDSPQYAIYVI